MSRRLDVFLLPALAADSQISDRLVAVIDVLRATTTIAHALEAGADSIIPCVAIDDAIALAEANTDTLPGGERGGVRVEGFPLGNSPADYAPSVVRGKTIALTTTNGTAALDRCRSARRVVTTALVNYAATCASIRHDSADVTILCAGADGEIAREDVIAAGAIVDELTENGDFDCNDQAFIARDVWRAVMDDIRAGKSLAEELRDSQGGRNLIRIGYEHDLAIAAQIDKFEFVCELDISQWKIRIANK